MTTEEIIDTIHVLCEMGTYTYTYTECKYTLLAVSRQSPAVNDFMKELFRLADQRRPRNICMGVEP